ncbi:MAG TPA: hypothetical protein VEM15_18255 [Thermodesulfobacteriota bacterium]|nr:hypothetical protein [Thermodesulfobacteriota bacterium]
MSEIWHKDIHSQLDDFRKEEVRNRVIGFTSPHLKIVLIGDDYALKVSITKNKGRAFSDPALRNISL